MDALKYANLAVAAVMAVGSLSLLAFFSIPAVAQTIVGVALAGAIGYLEFHKPPLLGRYASFLFSFVGRAALCIYWGLLLLTGSWFRIGLGLALIVAGGAYAALEVSHTSLPESMRLDPEVPIDTI